MYGKTLSVFNQKQFWSYLVKGGITLLMLLFVGKRIISEGGTLNWDFSGRESSFLFLVLMLLPLNLGLEAKKWQLLQVSLEKDFSFHKAFKGILIGTCLGLFTPNRLGDYMGRLMMVRKEHRWESGTFILINRLSQMLITLILGILAMQLALSTEIVALGDPWRGFFSLLPLVLFFLLLAFFAFKKVLLKVAGGLIQGFSGPSKALFALAKINPKKLWKVCSLAFLRYVVFSAQYLLLLYAFGADGTLMEMTLLVVLVFLIKSLAPIASLAELGIREAVAVMVGAWLGLSGILASTTAFSLYLVNLVLPAIIGLGLIFKEKYK